MTEKEHEELLGKLRMAEGIVEEKKAIDSTLDMIDRVDVFQGHDQYGNHYLNIDGTMKDRLVRSFRKLAEERTKELDEAYKKL